MTASVNQSLLYTDYLKEQQAKRNTGDTLGKDAFLKILMTQLQNQDMNNPMEDKDFIAQMAQFSSLEQMTNMATNFEKLANMQQQSQLITYNQFVGKEVKWHKIQESDEPNGNPGIQEGTGTIQTIQYKDGSVFFVLEDGTKLEPANISEVNQSGSAAGTGGSLLQASELIGRNVTWKKDETEQHAIVKSVFIKDNKVLYELNDNAATTITADQITKISA
ncbi:flagellar hook assembly protein FlgD [Bacillus testis]|uniref:flagellar hook assembly protein FlgD n=1 Tax=Bacillus testis TaxID=1622072 RepID=UPI00067F3515|nr:flagellar hook assembly protein FlgD [Bacillus testis]